MEIIAQSNYNRSLLDATDQLLAKLGHVNRVIEALNVLQTQVDNVVKAQFASQQFVSQSLVVAATTAINATGNYFQNLYSSSALTAVTITYANIPDGGTITWDYLKTTASALVITFPAGSLVSAGSDAVVSGGGLVATLASTASGRFTITILNINGTYKVYIVQDVA